MTDKKTAVFAGSFDPITLGHESVILRALPLFDRIVVAIGINNEKRNGMFPLETRKAFIRKRFENEPKIEVGTFASLTVDYCNSINARFLLRGLRTAADFEFERIVGLSNKLLRPEVETVFLLTDNRYSFINSSVVRDILLHGGSPKEFVSEPVLNMIREHLSIQESL